MHRDVTGHSALSGVAEHARSIPPAPSMSPNPEGKSAEQILAFKPVGDFAGWSWHVFQALSWIDLAKRTQSTSALQYGALEFRLGMEYLLFELFYLASPGITEAEYEKCVGDPNEIKKLILKCQPQYQRLCRFTEISLALEPNAPVLASWSFNEVFSKMGYASELLHFIGTHARTHDNSTWFIEKLARLEKIVNNVRDKARQSHGIGLPKPSEMPSEVQKTWTEYSSGALSDDYLRLRLQLMQGVLRMRRSLPPL